MARCGWVNDDPLYIDYHDTEWGVPQFDDQLLFEKLILEGFQAGLSWITILRKRENFRKAFDQFDATKMVRYTPKKCERLMQDTGIIRNRLKIEAAISNARVFLDMRDSGSSLSSLFWDAVDGVPLQNNFKKLSDLPAQTEMSAKLSKELKRLGYKFVGPTTVYAHCQAMGLVNDHVVDCPRHDDCAQLSKKIAKNSNK